MNKSIIFVILSFFYCFFVSAQTTEEINRKFDSIYFHVATDIAGKDIDKAFLISDSLYQASVSEIHKVKSLMLSSSLYQQKGEPEQAIIQASKAEKIAAKNKLYEWQARISGFLSTQYRNMGLYERGKIYLDKGLKASEQIKNETQKNLYMGMVYQELTYYNIDKQEFDKAGESVRLADEYFHKLPPEPQKKYFIATNQLLFGRVYLKQEQYDISLEYYQKALALLADITDEEAIVNGFIYSGIGSAYLAKENYPAAKEYLSKADLVATSSGNINLKLEVYEAFSSYYQLMDDYKSHSLYREKYIEAQRLYESNQKKSIDNIIKGFHLSNKDLLSNSNLLKISIGILLFLGAGSLLLYQQKRKKDMRKFRKVIDKLTEEIKEKKLPVNENIEQKENSTPKKTVNISEKKEKEIIEGLREFEQGKGFLERNISLSTLAGSLNTNTIYLSHILNNGYNKDFNTYINELRINYIIEKLHKNKEYHLYKLSFLAEECGFSSHSKFSTVFKSVTGLTPTTFISYLKKKSV